MLRKTFRKTERLSSATRIRLVKETGRRLSLKPLLFFLLPNDLNHPRLAVALTRRSGNSVIRHRVKRRLTEFFRNHKGFFGLNDVFVYSNMPVGPLGLKTPLAWKEFEKNLNARLAPFKQR